MDGESLLTAHTFNMQGFVTQKMTRNFYYALLSRMMIVTAPSRRIFRFIALSGIILVSMAIHPFHEGESTICIVRNLFGIPCPGCGLTRAFLFLGHGDIYSALRLNINSLLVFSAIVFLWLHAAFTIITGKEVKVRLAKWEECIVIMTAAAVMISGWLYNVFLNPWV